MVDEGCEPHPEYQILDPGVCASVQQSTNIALPSEHPQLAIDTRPDVLPDAVYRDLIRSLNEKQRNLFDYIFHWYQSCVKSKKHGQKPEPFYIFLSGKTIFNITIQQ